MHMCQTVYGGLHRNRMADFRHAVRLYLHKREKIRFAWDAEAISILRLTRSFERCEISNNRHTHIHRQRDITLSAHVHQKAKVTHTTTVKIAMSLTCTNPHIPSLNQDIIFNSKNKIKVELFLRQIILTLVTLVSVWKIGRNLRLPCTWIPCLTETSIQLSMLNLILRYVSISNSLLTKYLDLEEQFWQWPWYLKSRKKHCFFPTKVAFNPLHSSNEKHPRRISLYHELVNCAHSTRTIEAARAWCGEILKFCKIGIRYVQQCRLEKLAREASLHSRTDGAIFLYIFI